MAQTIDSPKQQEPGKQRKNLFSCLQTGYGGVEGMTTWNTCLKLAKETDLDQILRLMTRSECLQHQILTHAQRHETEDRTSEATKITLIQHAKQQKTKETGSDQTGRTRPNRRCLEGAWTVWGRSSDHSQSFRYGLKLDLDLEKSTAEKGVKSEYFYQKRESKPDPGSMRAAGAGERKEMSELFSERLEEILRER